MHFSENFKQALQSLGSNKLRSILTMLGIVMGVFSVVAIMAISNAAKSFMLEQFDSMGANTVMVQYKGRDIEESDRFSMKDIENIQQAISEVKYAAAEDSSYGAKVKFDEESREGVITGVSSQYSHFMNVEISAGRYISQIDNEKSSKVTFILDVFAKKYFGSSEEALGKIIRVTTSSGDVIKLRIIGIQSTADNPFASMIDWDEYPVYLTIPLTTYQELTNVRTLDGINISVKESDQIKATGNKVVKLLEFTHNNSEKYMVQSVQEIQKQVDDVLGTISMVLLVIAIITLIVGGIGIINILLVSVTERIREIGIRKALGAQKKDIVLQFLTESILMTGTSGLIGIILGMICGAIISAIIKIPPVVDLKTIVFTFSGSVVLGLIFGVYPAKKAADLDPIESLRYE